jgi:hypothetical protein
MYDYVDLGSAPSEEECVQVSRDGFYLPAMRAECKRYRELLETKFPVPDGLEAWYSIKSFPHDFGTYLTVCCVYSTLDPAAEEWAWDLEDKTPTHWESIQEREVCSL